MPFGLTRRGNSGDTVPFFRKRYTPSELQDYTLFGDIAVLGARKDYYYILWRSEAGSGLSGFWDYFDIKNGNLLFLIHMTWPPGPPSTDASKPN